MNIVNHKFIVWGFEHYNPLGIVRSLGEEGIKSYVIIIRGTTGPITSVSKYIKEKFFVDSAEEGYELLLEKFGENESDKPFVITSDDTVTSLIDMRYEELKDKFVFFNAGENGRITFYMDKSNINELAKKHGLKVLPTYRVKIGEIPDDIEFPVITKAVSSIKPGWKANVFVCHNRNELLEAYKHIQSEEILLQKYLTKKNELCLDGFSVANGRELSITIASNYNSVNKSSYSNNMTIFKLDNPDIEIPLRSMMREIGFEGIWSTEFLVDQNNDLFFLEVNFRNSTWSYAATCLGMNMVIAWSKGMWSGKIPQDFEKNIPTGYMAIAELEDYRDRVKTHKISLIRWLRELKKYDCKFLYNKWDMKPFWSAIFSIIKRKTRKLLHRT